jgi:hypothetical protein
VGNFWISEIDAKFAMRFVLNAMGVLIISAPAVMNSNFFKKAHAWISVMLGFTKVKISSVSIVQLNAKPANFQTQAQKITIASLVQTRIKSSKMVTASLESCKRIFVIKGISRKTAHASLAQMKSKTANFVI